MRADTAIPHREPAGGIEEACRDPNALIVIASHGRSGLACWWMGSLADKVLHTADNPVFVIRVQSQAFRSPDEGPRRLFVPLDGSELAEMVLSHVSYLASRMGLPVTLLQITPSEEEYYRYAAMGPGLAPASVQSAPSVFELVQMAGQEGSAYLEEVKPRLVGQGVETVDTEVTRGTPANVIVDKVSEAEGNHPRALRRGTHDPWQCRRKGNSSVWMSGTGRARRPGRLTAVCTRRPDGVADNNVMRGLVDCI
jgi:nucleotide-binding universal stress UspA family protein